jgi:hypothetical protein
LNLKFLDLPLTIFRVVPAKLALAGPSKFVTAPPPFLPVNCYRFGDVFWMSIDINLVLWVVWTLLMTLFLYKILVFAVTVSMIDLFETFNFGL